MLYHLNTGTSRSVTGACVDTGVAAAPNQQPEQVSQLELESDMVCLSASELAHQSASESAHQSASEVGILVGFRVRVSVGNGVDALVGPTVGAGVET